MNQTETIKLNDLGSSLGTRDLGAKLKIKAQEAIANGNIVFFDFSKVDIISSAFADELFGKLFIELGEAQFKSKIKLNKFENQEVGKIILLIINKAITFRKNQLSDSSA
ncbi:STAS-like domain-containing protein [Candidatus Margulisiibacteriota bacterium]